MRDYGWEGRGTYTLILIGLRSINDKYIYKLSVEFSLTVNALPFIGVRKPISVLQTISSIPSIHSLEA